MRSESHTIVDRKRDERRSTMAMHILSVDLQNEFCAEGGALYFGQCGAKAAALRDALSVLGPGHRLARHGDGDSTPITSTTACPKGSGMPSVRRVRSVVSPQTRPCWPLHRLPPVSADARPRTRSPVVGQRLSGRFCRTRVRRVGSWGSNRPPSAREIVLF